MPMNKATPRPSPSPSMLREEEQEEDEEATGAAAYLHGTKLAPHPYRSICHPMTIFVNYRRWGDSPRHPRLPRDIELTVCACRSIPHVWGLFATHNKYAARHNPDGSVLAADLNLQSFRRIHYKDYVLAAFDEKRPLWIFSVDYREHRQQLQNQQHQHQNNRHNHNRDHRHRHRPSKKQPERSPALISCCNIM